MALQTLKGIKNIGDTQVLELGNAINVTEYDKELKAGKYICINHARNSISFTIQNGPIKEKGVNGCQIDDMLEACGEILRGLNKAFPCRENENAISHINQAVYWLKLRKADREFRKVEGLSKQ